MAVSPSVTIALFGHDWPDVDETDVRDFLAAAGDEGLTWEAKGDPVTPEMVIKATSAFGNSVLGGYLILGATQDSSTRMWSVPGARIPGNDAPVWVSEVLKGVSERPQCDVHAWPALGAHLVLVQITPSPVPPVITRDGLVYERLPGQSPKVKDRTALAALFARGEVARTRAESMARSAFAADRTFRDSRVDAALTICPTGLPRDISATLFTERFGLEVRSTMGTILQQTLATPELFGPRAQQWQDRLEAWFEGPRKDTYGVTVRWDGSVTITHITEEMPGASDAIALMLGGDLLEPMWTAAAEVAGSLGGYGPAYFALAARRRDNRFVDVGRWTEVATPTAEMIASITRELSRTRGDFAPEPAPV